MWLKIFLVAVLILSLSGCATTKGKVGKATQLQQMRARISELEAELREKENEVSDLEGELKNVKKAQAPAKTSKISIGSAKEIQAALKKAGFYKGAIDGKIGENTKKAIREFQKANALIADGTVGEKTWVALRKYAQ